MARSVRSPKLDTRSARTRLSPRREPYWAAISPGHALGYRRSKTAGTWIARRYDRNASPQMRHQALGAADDVLDADGSGVLTFAQAQERARAWFADLLAGDDEPAGGSWTVADALDAYLEKLQAEGRPSFREARSRAGLIRAELGDIELANLTADRLRKFLSSVASAPRRVRGKKGKEARYLDPPVTENEKRARQSTANRIWSTLRATLNDAHARGKVDSDSEWRRVKPFRGVDSARIRFLTVAEGKRLINAAQGSFRDLVSAALSTGARYGELCRLQVSDYDGDAGTLLIRQSKSGRPRHIYLTDEGRGLFDRLSAGRKGSEPLLARAQGLEWKPSDQLRPMAEAVKAGKIDPPITFHGLRHTYASLAVMKGAPLPVVAHNLGHTSTRMVEKHYGHLAPSYLADTTRKTAPTFGLRDDGAMTPMRRRAK